MNQILMTENKKKSKSQSGPMDVASIIKFFAIALIVFGVFFIGQGSYAIYKQSKGKNIDNMPTVKMSRINDTVVLKVNAINQIGNLIYSWNDSEETIIPVENTYIEESIILPMENSVLNVKIEEVEGRVIRYQKEFIVEGIDITEPTIADIEKQGNTGKVKITATDETEISYITYKINDGQEVRIDRSGLEKNSISYILELPRGENKVIITAVDATGNIAKSEETIIVSERTQIRAEVKNGQIIIIANDPDGVRDIEVNLNGRVHSQKDINQKEARVPIDLVQGINTISIKVTNVNSLVTTVTTEYKHGQ